VRSRACCESCLRFIRSPASGDGAGSRTPSSTWWWLDAKGLPYGFQLCYDKGAEEHAVTWKQGVGVTHNRVDDGERTGERRRLTPVLVPDGVLPAEALVARFRQVSRDLDPDISELVLDELLR
jgi:hypothetical protein